MSAQRDLNCTNLKLKKTMRVNVKLGLWRMSIAEKIAKIRFIIMSLIGNAWFPSPAPTPTTITTNVNNLEAANLKAQGGGADDVAAMRVAEAKLDLSVKLLAAYVENIANADPANAVAIILSAGMEIKGKGGRTNQGSDVVAGKSGEIIISCPAEKGATYEFQMCTDFTNEANWKRIYIGTKSKFVMKGLTPGMRYYFRVCAITKEGVQPWTVVKGLFVN
jgi:hypothetical protein